MGLERSRLQVELASQRRIYLGHRNNETDTETDGKTEDETFQESDDNRNHRHFRRMFGGQVSGK